MEKLKPYIQDILYKIILPILYINGKDMETFTDDPKEFINSHYDFLEASMQPKSQACELLCDLCKYSSTAKKVQKKNGKMKKKKGKPDYLHAFVTYVVNMLTEYQQKIQSGQGADWRVKEALIYAIGSLKDEIQDTQDIYSQIEMMLKTHVMPELTHPEPMMRLRACWCYGVYGSGCEYKDIEHL